MSPVIRSKENWEVNTQAKNQQKGKLIRVEISPGRFVKMYESDFKAQQKQAPAPKNKLAPIAKNKAQPIVDDYPAHPLDDLTEIDGIGPATARKLQENGILSFAALMSAGELDYLSERVNESIRTWRESNG